MATVKLVASTYTRSNSNYVTVTDPSYMYDDTSDTSDYATIRGRAGRSSNTTYYCYLHGFNFSAVPSNATVTGFTVKIKGYRNSYLSVGSSYRCRLCGSATNSAISGTTCDTDFAVGVSTLHIPTGSLTWEQIVNYGSGFGIQLRLRNSSTSSSNYPYLYIYGAEIEVTYTLPATKYTVSASTSETDINISKYPNRELDSGETVYVYISGNLNDIVVYDNNVNVTSSLVYGDVADNTTPEVLDRYIYTISNVQADHAVVVSHSVAQTTYTVTIVNNAQSLSVSTSADNFNGVVGSGRGCLVYIDGSDFTDLYVEDNGTNVTSSLVYVPEETSGNETYPAYYYYYIGNISANHTVVVSRSQSVSTYTVSGTATGGLTLSADYNPTGGQSSYDALPITANAGTDVTIYIDGNDFTGFTLLDNNVDVTAQCSYTQPSQNYPAGYYTYVITNIQSAHTLTATVSSASTYRITVTSTSPSSLGALIIHGDIWQGGGQYDVPAGDDVTLYIAGVDGENLADVPRNISVTLNGVDVTSDCVYYAATSSRHSHYELSLLDINADQNIVLSLATAIMPVRVKRNGTWVTAVKVFVKRSGSWVEGTVKVKNNGNWS